MKLCFIANPNSTHTKRWVEWFFKRGHQVILIADVSPEERWTGIDLVDLPSRINMPVIKYAFWEIWTKQIIHNRQPDILHAHRVSSAGWLGAFSNYHPFVVTPWGSDLYLHPQRSLFARHLAKFVLKRADLVTADSDDLRNTAIKFGAQPDQAKVIQWGVDFHLFYPGIDVSRLRGELGIGNSRIVFSIRGLHPIYNIHTIVHSIPLVIKKLPETIFILRDYNTDEVYKSQILALIERLGVSESVRWLGRVEPWERIADYYQLAELAVSIPSSDGTPVSVLEAMACGVPVIASKLASLQEWIDDGESGWLVPIGDAVALAEAIVQLLQDVPKRQLFVSRSLDRVRERADHQSEMMRMESLYAGLIRKKA